MRRISEGNDCTLVVEIVRRQNGAGVVVAKPPSKLFGKIKAAAVTLEPAGGLPKPSGEMYLRGSL
ncbi:MAG: anti-sigma factor [Candidatus Binatia bacterium]